MKPHILIIGPDERRSPGGMGSVISTFKHPTLLNKYRLSFVSSYSDDSRFLTFLNCFIQTFRYLLFEHVDIVHLHSASRGSFFRKSILLLVTKLFRKNVIFHLHGGGFSVFFHDECGVIKQKYIRFILRQADRLVALSNLWNEELVKIVKEDNNIVVISNGVNVDQCVKIPHSSRSLVNILYLGKLEEKKGVYDLITAVQPLINQNKDLKLILAGNGEVEKVRQVVSNMGFASSITVPGWIDNKEDYLSQADIFVLPSYHEGLPMAILEAAVWNIPVITTPVGGIPEIIQDGINGYLVKPGCIDDLRRRLVMLIESQQLREQIGIAGGDTVRRKYDLTIILKLVDKLWQDLIP